jgi:hypothetical protein
MRQVLQHQLRLLLVAFAASRGTTSSSWWVWRQKLEDGKHPCPACWWLQHEGLSCQTACIRGRSDRHSGCQARATRRCLQAAVMNSNQEPTTTAEELMQQLQQSMQKVAA